MTICPPQLGASDQTPEQSTLKLFLGQPQWTGAPERHSGLLPVNFCLEVSPLNTHYNQRSDPRPGRTLMTRSSFMVFWRPAVSCCVFCFSPTDFMTRRSFMGLVTCNFFLVSTDLSVFVLFFLSSFFSAGRRSGPDAAPRYRWYAHRTEICRLKRVLGITLSGKTEIWVWVKIKPPGDRMFSPWFHLPGCAVGYLFLTRCHLGWAKAEVSWMKRSRIVQELT